MQFDITNIRRTFTEFGIALVIVAIPLGMIVKVLFGNMLFGNASMLFGILMMFPFRRIPEGFHFGKLAGIVFFLLLSFVYYFCSKFDEHVYLLYLSVSLVFTLGLSLLDYENDLKFPNVILYMGLLSLITVLGGYVGFITGEIDFLKGAFSYNEEGDTIYDGLTMGNIAIVQMVCAFYFMADTRKYRKVLPLIIILLILDFFMVLLSFKRTPMLVALLVLIYYFRRYGYLSFTPKKLLSLVAILAIIIIYVMSNEDLIEGISVMTEKTVEGITGLVTGEGTGNTLTNSTDMRLDNRNQALAMISRFDILESMIGSGFMTFWFDMPLLQAYLDMGVIGFLVYGYYVGYLPFNIIFSKKKLNSILCFAGMLNFYNALCCLTSGHPYGQTTWLPIALMCFVLNHETSKTTRMMTEKEESSLHQD